MKTEEEQVEALKNWWKANGTGLIAAVAVAIASVTGWNWYQDRQQASAEQASAYYQRMLGISQSASGAMGQEDIATLRHFGDILKADYGDSSYAQYAALMQAKVAVEQADLEAAAAQLGWVLEQQPGIEIKAVSEIRLARVKAASGDFSGALGLLADADDGFAAVRLEARGDVLVQQGDLAAARSAYAAAAAANDGAQQPLLQLKLDDLAQ